MYIYGDGKRLLTAIVLFLPAFLFAWLASYVFEAGVIKFFSGFACAGFLIACAALFGKLIYDLINE
jgi:hypothetical protein